MTCTELPVIDLARAPAGERDHSAQAVTDRDNATGRETARQRGDLGRERFDRERSGRRALAMPRQVDRDDPCAAEK